MCREQLRIHRGKLMLGSISELREVAFRGVALFGFPLVWTAVEMALNSMIEADPASRRLLIRNVGFNTTEETLYKSLETYGEIDDFKLVCDRQSGTGFQDCPPPLRR